MLAALLLVIGTDQTPPTAPPRDSAPQPVSAAISGLISEQGSGRPLPRALVTLRTASSQERSREVVADAQGRYEITGIEPGEYTLVAGPGEMRATHLRQAFGQAAPMDASMGMPRSNITLKAGEARSDVNIPLARALAIEGRILNQHDEPMADVEVRAVRNNAPAVGVPAAHSDDRGEFRLWGLAPGRYRVCATTGGRFVDAGDDASSFVRTCHLASTSETAAADVVLDKNDATGIDVRLQRAAAYSISGSVTDAAGVMVDGGFVDAMREDGEGSASARTQSGRFILQGVTPGRYVLHAGVGGPANPGDLHPPTRERERGYTRFVVDGSDLTGIHLQLSKARTIAGRVAFEGDRAPRASALRMVVQTRAPGEERALGRPPFSPVNNKLEFELKELFQLPLVVTVQGQPDGWAVKEIRLAGRDITDVGTNFGVAPPDARLEVVLTSRVAAASVRVTDDHGDPVTFYRPVVLPVDPKRWKGGWWDVSGMPSTDGILKLGPRPAGEYLIAAISREEYFLLHGNPARVESLASIARRVTLVAGDNLTIDLRLTRLPEARQ
jgi:hypothetical protein